MKRKENVNIIKGITIISISTPLISSTDENTHKWKIWIQGDHLKYIKTVTYILHETFPNNIRETQYPFVLEEKGWGEFKIQIKLKFIDNNEKSITMNHFLKLQDIECISKTYEEIVFRSPSNVLYEVLGESAIFEDNNEELERIEKAIDYVLNEYEKI